MRADLARGKSRQGYLSSDRKALPWHNLEAGGQAPGPCPLWTSSAFYSHLTPASAHIHIMSEHLLLAVKNKQCCGLLVQSALFSCNRFPENLFLMEGKTDTKGKEKPARWS
jgi:hypothetical protein